ncbi:TPA: cell division topological specificity factor MinE [Candidatus Poribacteria bacterium]|nr:cell division topological specificity factor MinE [Candidatus Poribacteria bacterium]
MFESIIKWLKGEQQQASKDICKNRLKVILAYDRTEISPEILDALKEDMFLAISKYFDIKEEDVMMNISRSDESVALMANIPIIGMKRQPIA